MPSAKRKRPYHDDTEESEQEMDLDSFITVLFQGKQIKTKSGWCLRDGMTHILQAEEHSLLKIVKQTRLPNIYRDSSMCRHEAANQQQSATSGYRESQNCFESLCRIVAGQQIAGPAVKTVWGRFVTVTKNNVTPTEILRLAQIDVETDLQRPAGLSRAKARTIVALAEAFEKGTLSETLLTSTSTSEEQIRNDLLKIKGIGPWSCDMFLIFYLERPDIFPIGDLGVRKGIAKLFSLHGNGSNGSLCPKKDVDLMEQVMDPYRPYRSLATYYMWKITDSKDDDKKTGISSEGIKLEVQPTAVMTPERRTRKSSRIRRQGNT